MSQEKTENLKFTALRDQLPQTILNSLSEANVFFSKEYYAYTNARNEKIYYLWDNRYVLSIRVKKAFIFRAGLLDSEPFSLKQDNLLNHEKAFMNRCCEYIKKIICLIGSNRKFQLTF